MTNNNIPQSHHSESNQGLSVTGTVESPHPSSERPPNTDLREIVIIPDSTEAGGSQDNPILLDSNPEPTVSPTINPRHSGPRRNVGPPQFHGNRRFIDMVLEKDASQISSIQTEQNTYVEGNTKASTRIRSISYIELESHILCQDPQILFIRRGLKPRFHKDTALVFNGTTNARKPALYRQSDSIKKEGRKMIYKILPLKPQYSGAACLRLVYLSKRVLFSVAVTKRLHQASFRTFG